MNKTLVLVVDDEKPLRDFVRRNLEVRDLATVTAASGLEALAIFHTQPVDLVILDLMMPGMDGLETIRRIRTEAITPIIVLSALGEESDKMAALEIGADDYLTKPFGVGELLARVHAVLRRSQWTEVHPQVGKLVKGDLLINLESHEVFCQGDKVNLTPTEYKLLVYLVDNADRVLPHQTILQNVWGQEYGQEAEYLRVYIGHLRQKLENDPANPSHLITERGIGYSFRSR